MILCSVISKLFIPCMMKIFKNPLNENVLNTAQYDGVEAKDLEILKDRDFIALKQTGD